MLDKNLKVVYSNSIQYRTLIRHIEYQLIDLLFNSLLVRFNPLSHHFSTQFTIKLEKNL